MPSSAQKPLLTWNGNAVNELPQLLLRALAVLELHAHALRLLLQGANLCANVTQVRLELAQHVLHGRQDVVAAADLQGTAQTSSAMSGTSADLQT